MSSFFNRQPEMFDSKKRGIITTSSSSSQDQKNSSDEGEYVQESWVELAPSRASLCSSVEATMLAFEGSTNGGDTGKGSRLSPVSLQSPHVELASLEQVKDRLNCLEMLPRGSSNTDWIWDWSHDSVLQQRNQSGQVGGSTLTTPPNSPVPGSSENNLKIGRKAKKSRFWGFGVVLGFVMSNCVFLLIGCTLGFYICKKMQRIETKPMVWREYW